MFPAPQASRFLIQFPSDEISDILVNKDWVVAIVEPIDEIRKSYEEKMNGRGNGIADGRTGGGNNNSSIDLNESISFS